ncbi:MAG TPA: aminopeptidase [Steroidobacteraceae bacterium]|nr:aminopeptidase [Steroidobacteraceae bacterium]
MLTETATQAARLALVSALVLALPGCYVLQAAHGEVAVLAKRRPIAQVIEDPKTPPRLRATLEQVRAAREFATRELYLPNNRSYRTYADIGRPYVVWNVVAAPEFSVVPQHWCFPIVGCVAYRGYFSERRARAFAAQLKARGFDVSLGGVPAYSTLGRFADPVLNTMLPYGNTELAGIIFHELAHQLLYVPGDSSFNEAFAVTVEHEGVKRWLLLQGRAADLARYEAADARDLAYVRLFRRYRAMLARLYASGLAVARMRERKRAVFAALAADMSRLAARSRGPAPYQDWIDAGLNNADLASVATYYDCVPGFERLLRADGGDLKRFYANVRNLAHEPQTERDAAVCSAQRSAPARSRSSRAGSERSPR